MWRSRKSLKILIVAGWLVATMSSPCHADRIRFKDGRELEAFIVRRSESQVVIRDGKTQIIVPAESIISIEAGSEADHLLLKGRDALGADDVEQGIKLMAEAVAGGASKDEAIKLLILYQERISDSVNLMTPQGIKAFGDLLDGLRETHSTRQGEWLAVQLRWRIQLGEADEISLLLKRLRESEARTLEMRHEDILKWLGAKTDEAIEEDDYSLALDLLLEMGRLDNTEAGSRRLEMAMLWARRERDRNDFATALRVYQDQLLPLSPQIALDRISVTLEEAEKHYRNTHELGRAIDLYEQFGMTHEPEQAEEKLIELWHEFGRGFLAQGEIAEARQVFERSESFVAGSAARELALCDHAEMKAGLAKDNFVGHYKLGEWCVEKGLLDEARDAFQVAGGSDVLRETVWEQVQLINDRQAEEELKRLLNLYEAGQYVQVIDGVIQFKSRAAAEGLHLQATQLERLARDAIAVSAAERPQQAEVLMQQAERAYWTGDVDGSHELLKTLMAMYSDTPAGARASQFYRTIKPRLDLNTLEKRRGRGEELGSSPGTGDRSSEVESGIAEEIRRLRDAMRERDVEQSGEKGNNDSTQDESPAVDLSDIPGQP